ncbi:hypothetical protein GDO81_026144 [Engystomops pustulosus]|uniref:Uncharacterized protein n=2 Tax=Engystomops pustulosus TaxID=76066 RepID=A0AAV6YZK8_ENGPU|nr:hypothetical protein GDO81_026150 [Engystomops pustulosus]KAG8542754.1 hypothetical protein GDO81_026144 [Engystomops pustulosus]
MSSSMNGDNSCDYGCVHYRPPGYPMSSTSQMSNIRSAPPATQQWDNSSPPPAYDTIDRIPGWNEHNPYLYTSPTIEIWIPRTENNVFSTSQVSNVLPSAQQAPDPQDNTPNTPSVSPDPSGLSTLSHQNTGVPQNTDLKDTMRRFQQKILGILLIIVFIIEISLGISVESSPISSDVSPALFGIVYWVPAFHIVAGIALIVSWTRTSICSVQCALYMNVLSFLVSGIGLAFYVYNLNGLHCTFTQPTMCHKAQQKATVIYCCLIGLNALTLFISFVASCIGCAFLEDRSPSHVLAMMPLG